MKMSILEVKKLQKIYTTRLGGHSVRALENVNFSVDQGEYVAIMGESGSGKTTLLNILAALDRPTSGSVILDGMDLTGVKENEMAAFRRKHLGFVFQEFNLLDTFSIKDNILLPLVLSRVPVSELQGKLDPIASALGISDILAKYPYEVSGGQKQRAAAARAIITGPKLLLADEPTGALDSKSTDSMLETFEQPTAGQAGFGFEAPAAADPPGIAVRQAKAVEVALEAVVNEVFVQVERGVDGGHVVVHIYKVCRNEVAGADIGRVVTDFGGDHQVTPFGSLVGVLVPEEEAVPPFEAGVGAEAHVIPEGDLDAEVRGAGGVVGHVVADRKTVDRVLPVNDRRFTLDGHRHGLVSDGALKNNFAVLCTQGRPGQPDQQDHHHPFVK